MVDYRKVLVESLVPHSPPMVLIDEVLEFDDNSLLAAVDIYGNCMFYNRDIEGVPAWVGIEYMAQAISAFAGIQALKRGEEIKPGFLLGTRKLLLYKKVLKAGQRYEIRVTQLIKDTSGLASFASTVTLGAEVCVEAKVNVFEAANSSDIRAGMV